MGTSNVLTHDRSDASLDIYVHPTAYLPQWLNKTSAETPVYIHPYMGEENIPKDNADTWDYIIKVDEMKNISRVLRGKCGSDFMKKLFVNKFYGID